MSRLTADPRSRTVSVDTGLRSLDMPVGADGRLRRFVTLDSAAVQRGAAAEDTISFRGHAAVFNTRAWIGSKRYGFGEVLMPGAFAKTIAEADVRMLHNHDPNMVLARTTNGTLQLSEDGVGLAVNADMNPTSYARDLALLLERRDVTQMSFGFEMIDYSWRQEDDGSETLVHREVALFDVSTVTYPAYVETDASLRADLLACARAQGFDALDIAKLAERLANPDDAVMRALRTLAGIRSDTAEADAPPVEDASTEESAAEVDAEPNPADIARDSAFAKWSSTLLEELMA